MRARSRRLATVALTAAGLSLGLGACGGDDEAATGDTASGGGEQAQVERVAAVIKPLDNPFFAAMEDGIQAAAQTQDVGVEVTAASSLTDTSGQAARLETLIGQSFGCYVVNPISETNLVQPLAQLDDAVIVNIDSPIGEEAVQQAGLDVATYIGTDNVQAGRLAAEEMARNVDDGAPVGVIGGIAGDPTSAARIDGFREAAQGRFEPMQTVAADWDRAQALNAAGDLLRANPDIQGFFAANDQMALGIAQAVRTAGRQDEVAIIGVDGIEDALQAVADGRMTATVSQYPYTIGRLGVEACAAAGRGQQLPAEVDAPVQVVNEDNVERAQERFPRPVDSFDSPFDDAAQG